MSPREATEGTSALRADGRRGVGPGYAAPLALMAAAFLIRCLPWPSVLTPESVQFIGTDSYYHLRRILVGLSNFPEPLEFDRYINFPHGAQAIWPNLFDSTLVLALRPFLDGSDPTAVERAVVWVPPLLGSAAVGLLYLLAARHFDRSIAFAAAAFLCVLSGHFWYSQIGFLDHHAAVAPASAILLFTSMNLLSTLQDASSQARVLWASVSVGIATAVCLLLWPGMLLHVSLAQLGLLCFLALRPCPAEAARSAAAMTAANASAFVLIAIFGAAPPEQFGPYSPVVLSRFQPWLLAALTLHAAGCWLLWRRGMGASLRSRLAHVLGIAALLAAASAALFPDLASGAFDAWRWLAKREHFQSTVSESRALFDVGGQFGVRIAEARLSRFIYLFPIALAALAWRLSRGRESSAVLLLLPWALGLAIVTVLQKRFFNSFSIPLALVMGWSLIQGYRALATFAGQRRGVRPALAGAAALLVLTLLAPVYAAYEQPIADQVRLLRGEEAQRLRAGPDLSTLIRTADWLRANTPETRGYFDGEQPEYGVLSLWRNGHLIEYVGRRASVTDSFGDDVGGENFALGLRYFASSNEAAGSEILDRLGVRYVFAESISEGTRASKAPSNLMEQLFETDGNGLGRHRLIFEAAALRGQPGRGPEHFKIFEHVAGAQVMGRAPPGARVSATLGFKTSRGRRGAYRSHTVADEVGSYELRLPYATNARLSGLQTAPAYELRTGSTALPFELSEDAIRAGSEVRGPTLRQSDSVHPQPETSP